MALRTIRIQGDPVLEKKCREITEMTPKIKELIDDMLETMYDAMGVGLAAPQVTYIMKELRDHGMMVSDDVTTIDEAKNEIKRYFAQLAQNRKGR